MRSPSIAIGVPPLYASPFCAPAPSITVDCMHGPVHGNHVATSALSSTTMLVGTSVFAAPFGGFTAIARSFATSHSARPPSTTVFASGVAAVAGVLAIAAPSFLPIGLQLAATH